MIEEPAVISPGMILQTVPIQNEEVVFNTYAFPDHPLSKASIYRGKSRLLVLNDPELIRGNTLVSPGGDRIRATLKYVRVINLDEKEESRKIEFLRVEGDPQRRKLVPRFIDSQQRAPVEGILARLSV